MHGDRLYRVWYYTEFANEKDLVTDFMLGDHFLCDMSLHYHVSLGKDSFHAQSLSA